MSAQFRFVEEPEPQAVILRLFVDADGQEKADIHGPLLSHNGQKYPNVDRCVVHKNVALAAAIRIANANDVEFVVLGNAASWDDRWGSLIREGLIRPWQ